MCTLLTDDPVREDDLGSVEPGDMRKRRDEIEELWLTGHSTKEIAWTLGGKPLDVARNLREVRKRWDRAAQRQQIGQAPRVTAIYQEAMAAWQRSQRTKTGSTKHYEDDRLVKTTVREANSAGDAGFLRTALAALKSLDLATEKQAAMPPRATKMSNKNELIVAMLNLLTPEQLQQLDAEQVAACRQAAKEVRSVERGAGSGEREEETLDAAGQSTDHLECEAGTTLAWSASLFTTPASPIDIGAVTESGRIEKRQQAAAVQKVPEAGGQEVIRTNKRRKRRSRFAMTPRRGNFIAGRRRNYAQSVRREVAVPQRSVDGMDAAPSLLDVYSAPTRVLHGSANGVKSLLCGENGVVSHQP